MHYFPDALILTHVEFDHADIYADLAAVKTAFKRLVNLVPRRGRIVAFDGSDNVSECVSRALCAVERYGFEANSTWRLTDLRFENGASRWRVLREGKERAELSLPMAGEHNALNATAAAALAAGQGIAPEPIAEALATFRSVRRRLEVRAEINGITIIDDFVTIPPRSAKPCALCVRLILAGRSGPCSNLAPTLCAATFSSTNWSRACPSPTASSSPASFTLNKSPHQSACIRKM